jgi:hypothetical protein
MEYEWSPRVKTEEDITPYIKQEEDDTPYIKQEEDDTPYVKQEEDDTTHVKLEEDPLEQDNLNNIPRPTPEGKFHGTFREMMQFATFKKTIAKAVVIEWCNNGRPEGHFKVLPLNVEHMEKAGYYGYTCVRGNFILPATKEMSENREFMAIPNVIRKEQYDPSENARVTLAEMEIKDEEADRGYCRFFCTSTCWTR